MPSRTQRWQLGSPRWRPADEGGFDPDRYEVVPVAESIAADYIREHHYAKTLPSTTHRYALLDHAADQPLLVGVATLGVPMSSKVLTNAFPGLTPYQESLEFNRLVLAQQVPANGESWFCARVFRHAAAEHGVRGVLTFADPVPRWRTTGHQPELIKPGHVGIVYQALGFTAVGRSTPRTLILLPDATALTARALAKVTGRERGAGGVINRLVAFGATPPAPDAELRHWLAGALRTIGARKIRHPGNFRYALRIGTRAQRTRARISLAPTPYPKPALELHVA
jgi:hypothetical protein